jgi:hypothetical protein
MELMVLIAESASAPAALGRARGHANVGDVRRELHDHRGARLFLHPARDLLAVFGHLAHRRAHAALAHAVRAAEVELQAVGSGVFCALHNVVPGLALALDHQRSDDHVLG